MGFRRVGRDREYNVALTSIVGTVLGRVGRKQNFKWRRRNLYKNELGVWGGKR